MLRRNRIYIFQTPDGRRQRRLPKSPVATRRLHSRQKDQSQASPSPHRPRTHLASPYTPIRGDDGIERLKEKEATRSDIATTPFEQLPDHTPPISTLNAKGKTLKVEWKGSPVDLSNDPDIAILHPEEVKLAALLRLSVHQYRDCKLRIFWEFYNRRLQSKTFRRTDSQRVCRVDVNKASKLWAAFEKVGWFDEGLWERIDKESMQKPA
ncbi:SWIRM domain-containing protein laf1 [Neolecta irregularis DAH-3]|uniref:SWIRM domain-containing protein laf1 n=1 Tax=Neolecta irregularis (strain DAH-3) TaxID=1198029 RepID=A0A1U7LNC1_NEOID|nr:SWIRM domain-containing protein laf1 [Neolecta irregularis DAH-3]|eukprot:OLL24042.1 SWIRM domain-containing protein laf1 [Neolecta irregularis DAH-3]